MKILLAGATGFIGKSLIRALSEKGYQLFLLTRRIGNIRDASEFGNTTVLAWDAKTFGEWVKYVESADAVINLSGESIAAKRWSKGQKQRLTESRIDSTRILVEAMAQSKKKPHTLINTSAVGYYGHVPEGDVSENFPSSGDFMGQLCAAWEAEALKAKACGVRVVLPRIGIVLGGGGGALEKMALPFKFFIGGPLGSGGQWMPWIHRDDVVQAILFLLENPALNGAVNLAAPNAVRMKEFCQTLGRTLGRPSWAPVPSFVLKLLLGEMSAVVLNGQKAVPKKLLEAGFEFQYPELAKALAAIRLSEKL